VNYTRDEIFLQVHTTGKIAKRVQPGQTVQLRNYSNRESSVIAKQRMLEMPASWWLSQPGIECLLAFVSGHADREIGAESSRKPVKVNHNVLAEKVIVFKLLNSYNIF
jgi:hypothetical protein